jgi:hypothetical protein
MKLVTAEYEHPEGRLTAWGARVHFLELIEELAPHVLDDLAAEPLNLFRKTGIGSTELTSKDIYSKREYRNIGTFWRSIESGRCNCDYYVDFKREGSIGLEERFLHKECELKMKAKWESLKEAGKVKVLDRLLVTKYAHYPKCPYFVDLHEALQAWKKRHNLTKRQERTGVWKAHFIR